MSKLHTVQLTKTTSCLTYALMRTGIDYLPELTDVADIESYFTKHELDSEETLRSLPVGTLLLFSNKEYSTLVPRLITEDGVIISQPTLIMRHIGVYEGRLLISDAGVSSKNFPFCKFVRIRNYMDMAPLDRPTHYLKFKDQ